MSFTTLLGSAADIGGSVTSLFGFGGFGIDPDRRSYLWRGVTVYCDPGCDCMHPEPIYQAVLAANTEEIAALAERWGGTLPGPTGRQYGNETLEQSVARLSFHTGGGRGCNFNDGERWRLNFIRNLIQKYNIDTTSGSLSPTPTATPAPEENTESFEAQVEALFSDILDVPISSVEAGIEETRRRASQASTAASLSDMQLLLIAGGIAAVGFWIARR